jgi:hypothetical protein
MPQVNTALGANTAARLRQGSNDGSAIVIEITNLLVAANVWVTEPAKFLCIVSLL